MFVLDVYSEQIIEHLMFKDSYPTIVECFDLVFCKIYRDCYKNECH